LGPKANENNNNNDDSAQDDERDIPGYPIGSSYHKVRKLKAFVEPAPSSDPSKPCFAAYLANYPISLDFDDDGHPPAHRRPLFGVRIYDVTTQASDADRIKALAVAINAATDATLHKAGTGPYYDRFEVVGMPLDVQQQGLSDREKARICADFDDKEWDVRMGTGDAGFYIPLRIRDNLYRRNLVMIDRLNATSGWENRLAREWYTAETDALQRMDPERSSCGTFSVVWWQPRTRAWEDYGETVPPTDDVHLIKYPFELFALVLGNQDFLRNGISTFYEHFVAHGRLEQELGRAKETAQQQGQHRIFDYQR
jgi:hypothetical protein